MQLECIMHALPVHLEGPCWSFPRMPCAVPKSPCYARGHIQSPVTPGDYVNPGTEVWNRRSCCNLAAVLCCPTPRGNSSGINFSPLQLFASATSTFVGIVGHDPNELHVHLRVLAWKEGAAIKGLTAFILLGLGGVGGCAVGDYLIIAMA